MRAYTEQCCNIYIAVGESGGENKRVKRVSMLKWMCHVRTKDMLRSHIP